MLNYLFEVVGEDSDLCGEQFFVQVNPEEFKTASKALAKAYEIARENFEGEEIRAQGVYSDEVAEWMGLDTY